MTYDNYSILSGMEKVMYKKILLKNLKI